MTCKRIEIPKCAHKNLAIIIIIIFILKKSVVDLGNGKFSERTWKTTTKWQHMGEYFRMDC